MKYSHLCACGCNGEIEIRKSHKSDGIPKYINGHNKANYKHGYKGTRLYEVWQHMKQRVLNTNLKQFKDWGGRGITICDEWLNFIPFRDWSLSNGYADNLVIDRKNSNGNYEPSNCRFITILESNRNKTNTITLEIANEIRELYNTGDYILKELAEKYGVSISTIDDIILNKRWKT